MVEAVILDGVTVIKDDAFMDCTKLKHVYISDGVTRIGNNAFNGCKSLTGIHIPDSVTEIGGSVFSGCKSLAEIHIPDGVTEIRFGTFTYFGDSLTEIHIPDSVWKIGDFVFDRSNVNVTCGPKVAKMLKGRPGIRSITVVTPGEAESSVQGYKSGPSVRDYGISPGLLGPRTGEPEKVKADRPAREVPKGAERQEVKFR